jgi:outer membrane immunogenic protein
MRRIALAAIAASVMFACGASAADMAVKTPPPAPVAIYSWTGFYIGGHVGGAWNREDATMTALPSPGFGAPSVPAIGLAGFGLLPTAHDLRRDQVLGGLYAGYNWQSGNWVLGVEADFSYIDGGKSNTQSLNGTYTGAADFNPSAFVTVSSNSHWLATARGRIGYAWDRTMLYVTGGAAFTDARYNLVVTPTGPAGLNGYAGGSASFDSDRIGYVVGVGGEWLATNNWVLRAEYLHYGFKGISGTMPVLGAECNAAANCRFVLSTSDRNIDTVRVGIAYKFGGPVVAKY